MNVEKLPLVSVLMTAFNREKYIAEAIESVLKSTYSNFELIIVDDCSMDDTVAIARRFAIKDDRIQLHVNEKNLDQFPNRNKAAGFAKGELIMSVDSDDTIKSDAIEYIVKQFENFPDAQFALIYGQNDIKVPTSFQPEESIKKHFYSNNHLLVGPGGTIIKTDFFKRIGGFPTVYGPAGDCFYNIKAAANGEVILFPYIFFNYRIHGEQEFFKKDSYLYNGYRYLEDVLQLPEIPLSLQEKKKLLATNKRNFLFNSLVYFISTGELKTILHAYKLARIRIKDIWSAIFI